MGCNCKEYPVGYLSLLNGLLSVIAVIIIGYTGAAIGKLGDFHVFVENNALTITGGFGVLLFMVSLIGLWGVVWKKKILLFIYIVGTLVTTVVIFIL